MSIICVWHELTPRTCRKMLKSTSFYRKSTSDSNLGRLWRHNSKKHAKKHENRGKEGHFKQIDENGRKFIRNSTLGKRDRGAAHQYRPTLPGQEIRGRGTLE